MHIHIPDNCWMRLRQKGRYLYAKKRTPIIWKTSIPPKGTTIYTIGWHNSQQNLMASEILIQP